MSATVAAFDVAALAFILLVSGLWVLSARSETLPHALAMQTGFGLLAASAFTGRDSYQIATLLRRSDAIAAAAPLFVSGLAGSFTALLVMGSSRTVTLTVLTLAAAGVLLYLVASRTMAARVVTSGVETGRLAYRILVIGSRRTQTEKMLGEKLEHGLLEIVETPGALTRERLDAIVLSYPHGQTDTLQTAYDHVSTSVLDIFLHTDIARCGVLPRSHPLASLPLLPLQTSALRETDMLMKGLFDRLVASLLVLLASPVLILTAVAIRLEGPGAILFRQPRIGYDNRIFSMYKFRSMNAHASDRLATRQTQRNDPRVTRVGRTIRRFSIDELPQLFNVIRGEMSLVGPRPHAPRTNVEGLSLEHAADGYKLRHRVMPGITGWAQINGSRGALVSSEQIQQRVRLDLEYIERWSPILDLKIIALTGLREIVSKAAY